MTPLTPQQGTSRKCWWWQELAQLWQTQASLALLQGQWLGAQAGTWGWLQRQALTPAARWHLPDTLVPQRHPTNPEADMPPQVSASHLPTEPPDGLGRAGHSRFHCSSLPVCCVKATKGPLRHGYMIVGPIGKWKFRVSCSESKEKMPSKVLKALLSFGGLSTFYGVF